MSTTEYGVITGVGFSLTFSTFGLLAGFFVDIQSERGSTILGISALFCSLITLATSLCTNFSQVLLLRAFLGALQAFGAPASVHLIFSFFTKSSDRPVANAAYTCGVYLGAGLSSLSGIYAGDVGWRDTFKYVGLIGITTALLYELIIDCNVACLSSFGARGGGGGDARGDGGMVHEKQPLMSDRENNRQRRQNQHHQHSQHFRDTESIATGSLDSLDMMRNGHDRNHRQNQRNSTRIMNQSSALHDVSVDTADTMSETNGMSSAADISYTAFNDLVPGEYLFSSEHQTGGGGGGAGDAASAAGQTYYVSDTDSFVGNSSNNNNNDAYYLSGGMGKFGGEDGIVGGGAGTAREALKQLLRMLCFDGSVPGAMPVLLVASCLRFSASIAVFVFVPVLVERRFPSQEATFSIFNAIVVLSCGSFSAFMGGKLGQYAVRVYGLSGLAKLISTSCILCVLPFVFVFLAFEFWHAMAMLALGYLLGEAWMGASMALLQGLSPRKGQGLAMSLYLFLNWNLSAVATDSLGYLDPGTTELSKLLILFVSIPILVSCALFLYLDRIITLHSVHLLVEARRRARAFSR